MGHTCGGCAAPQGWAAAELRPRVRVSRTCLSSALPSRGFLKGGVTCRRGERGGQTDAWAGASCSHGLTFQSGIHKAGMTRDRHGRCTLPYACPAGATGNRAQGREHRRPQRPKALRPPVEPRAGQGVQERVRLGSSPASQALGVPWRPRQGPRAFGRLPSRGDLGDGPRRVQMSLPNAGEGEAFPAAGSSSQGRPGRRRAQLFWEPGQRLRRVKGSSCP